MIGAGIILAVTGVLALTYYLFATAPEGYETDEGWFAGEPSDEFDNPDNWRK